MSSLAVPVVAPSPAINLPTRGDANAVNSWVLFTVPNLGPVRVDAVYMDVAFPDGTSHEESWELTLRAFGPVVGRVATQVVGSGSSFTGTRLTFARGLTGTTDTQPTIVYFVGDTDGTAILDIGLLEAVLPVNSTVELTLYETSEGGLPAVNITNIFVTYTPGSGGVSSTTGAVPFPLLTPTDGG